MTEVSVETCFTNLEVLSFKSKDRKRDLADFAEM